MPEQPSEPHSPFEVPGEPDAEERASPEQRRPRGAGLAHAANEEQAGQDPHATDAADPEEARGEA